MEKLNGNAGMTLIELVIYMAIVAVFMMAALFLLKAGNDFSSKARESMRVQTDIRLASISIKNALKRYDYKDGFELVNIDEAHPEKGRKLSFRSEHDSSREVYSLYFDKETKQLMQTRVTSTGSSVSNTDANLIAKPICDLENLRLSIDKINKTVTVVIVYMEDNVLYSVKETFHYKTNKFIENTAIN